LTVTVVIRWTVMLSRAPLRSEVPAAPTSSATLDTTTDFKGTIMALTSITLNNGATLQGRALARNGADTMDHNTIDSSACAAPSPTATPKATRKLGGGPAVTAPATDTIAQPPTGPAAPVSATLLVFLAISAIALVASLRFATARSRTRD
jgi:Ice-binding-like